LKMRTGGEGHAVVLPLPLKRSRSVHEFVKLAELDAAEECVPFVRGITEHRPIGALAVADADDAAGQLGYLDAVPVIGALRTLAPGVIGIGRNRRCVLVR
jgi:hypothetical protein